MNLNGGGGVAGLKVIPIFSVTAWKLIICWILVALFCVISVLIAPSMRNFYATFLSVLIFCSYIYNLKLFNDNLSDAANKTWIVPLIYSLVLLLVSVFYSIPVRWLEGVKENFGVFESFYYCLITLTTVGYGEFHPSGYAGQVLSSSMAIVGTIHMIMFISILVSNLKIKK